MWIQLSVESSEPMYEQIMSQVKESIYEGGLIQNQELPSIRSMANELGVSVITVKRAYSELEREGYIYTRKGIGSFAKEIPSERKRQRLYVHVAKQVKDVWEQASKQGMTKKEMEQIVTNLLKEEYDVND
ncbi:GntR family transcriptional regulator [Shouchella patagoniensis]|uniref:GntR family transcriptional regulator n=1 Tax=Shouchella patagoniensis TaxID=228576 RepID=UPI000994A68A|nr:GntR family transcriptional regulator [Shouchella patagoniensis]